MMALMIHFFVSRLVKGLRTDIGTGIQAHIPKTMYEVVQLAKRQQQVLDKGKQQWPNNLLKVNFSPILKRMRVRLGSNSLPFGRRDRPLTIGRQTICAIIVVRNMITLMLQSVNKDLKHRFMP